MTHLAQILTNLDHVHLYVQVNLSLFVELCIFFTNMHSALPIQLFLSKAKSSQLNSHLECYNQIIFGCFSSVEQSLTSFIIVANAADTKMIRYV